MQVLFVVYLGIVVALQREVQENKVSSSQAATCSTSRQAVQGVDELQLLAIKTAQDCCLYSYCLVHHL